ncbi:MAG: AAA family ATPase, partial [Sphingomonadaceae bacterium]
MSMTFELDPVGADIWSAHVDTLTESGHLRRLSGAFARFIGTLGTLGTPDAHAAPLKLACLLLSELEGRGHSCLLLSELAADPSAMLGWPEGLWQSLREAAAAATAAALPADAEGWRLLLAGCAAVWPVGGADRQQPLVLDGERLYLRRYWRDESMVAGAVLARALPESHPERPLPDSATVRGWLDLLFEHAPRGGTDWQKIACAIALRGRLGIITGGPGTGKTYTVARLLALLFATAGTRQDGLRIALAAPTGKAAARLKQSIDQALDGLAERVGSA